MWRALRHAGNVLVGSTVSFSTSVTTQSAGVLQVGARRLLSSASVVHKNAGEKTIREARDTSGCRGRREGRGRRGGRRNDSSVGFLRHSGWQTLKKKNM